MIALILSAATFAPDTASARWAYSERSSVAPFGEQVQSAAATLFSSDGATRLMVKCERSPKPALSVQLRRSEGHEAWGEGRLLLKFDAAPARQVSWEMMGGMPFTQGRKEAQQIAKALVAARAFLVEGRDRNGISVRATFATRVGTEPLERVIAAC